MRSFSLITFFLYLFTQFIALYLANISIISNHQYERMFYHQLERFSYIESYVLRETIDQFNRYKFDEIRIESNLGIVYVVFEDELAYIHYDFEIEVFATLEYDLVYDSALSYNIISEALFSSVDKISH